MSREVTRCAGATRPAGGASAPGRALLWVFLAFALAWPWLGCVESAAAPAPAQAARSGPQALFSPRGAASPDAGPGPAQQSSGASDSALELAQAMARALAETSRRARDLYELASALKLDGAPAPRRARDEPVAYRLGDRDTFWIGDQLQHTYYQTSARLVLTTPTVYWWLEEGQALSLANLERSAQRFETHIYPTIRRLFGEEWQPGADADPRLSVFLGRLPGVAGYFSSADEYPRSVIPHSNERDLIYLNVGVLAPGTSRFEGVLAHEFQHMVHWWQRRTDDTWINEGAAELAARLAGYSNDAARAFLRRPETQLTAWAQVEEGIALSAHYGAAYLFMRYVTEQFSEDGGLRDFLALPQAGLAAFDAYLARLGVPRTFDDIFADWIVANVLDADPAAGGPFAYRDRDVKIQWLEPAPLGRWETARTPQYAARYVDIPVDRGDLRLLLEVPAVAPLLATTASSGQAIWWSNRGDEMATRLTRAVDLRGLDRATLEFSTWFDIERDYDYAYVMVSNDGGRTWATLPGEHTTASNPNGANYGYGYTGRSGGGQQPGWVKERIDLTPFVEREILLRFALVTDDAYNAPGFAIDDIRVPELDFLDEAEGELPGWTAEGFVRGAPLVPQRFIVRLVLERETPLVQDLPPADGRLDVVLPLGGARRAVLVIAPVAPVTTELALYRYRLELAGPGD